jgi:bifunctional DNA-binding transcriptional regulator/antitoxin component of YhaV-PrlF toxin-antitoxin module
MIMRRLTITRGGQVSVPAAIRRRWGTSTVIAEDLGDALVLRPAPDDPIAAAGGALADELAHTPPTDDWRRQERELEAERDAGAGPAA